MSLYLDTSVLVALVIGEVGRPVAQAVLEGAAGPVLLNSFARAEFASAVARRVRTGDTPRTDAAAFLAAFDSWAEELTPCGVEAADIAQAEAWLRRLDINLRTPDALHLAAAGRLEARLATLDRAMADAARALDIPLAA